MDTYRVGFVVDFDVPTDLPLTEPPSFAGGGEEIRLDAVSLHTAYFRTGGPIVDV